MPRPWPDRPPTADERAAFAEALPRSFWLDSLPVGDAASPPLEGDAEADLCIVGGGFTGLWAALHAKADDPARDVLLLEAETIGHGASGRNGGFMSSSLTHGIANGLARFSSEMELLERLGRENFDGLVSDLARHSIQCAYEPSGELTVALEPHEEEWLEEEAQLLRRFGHDCELLDAAAMQAEIASPTYRAGLWHRSGQAMVDPARLALGLRDAALGLGVRVHERSPASGLREAPGGRVAVSLPGGGVVRARRVLLGTSAFPPLLRAIRRYVAPVYDYVLVTEPLTREQLDSIGWRRRQGVSDAGNQFHYYRLTPDDRILWGGFDAVYRFRGGVGPERDVDEATFGRLARNFFATFPQLRGGVRFSHRWGGAIDTCSRFSVFFGTALGGRVAYATGYTGLGVGATRFGARVALDLVDGRPTEATRSRYVRSRPVPFPPEPLRTAVIQLTRNRLAAADRNAGRRGAWLRTLDRLGLGFDS
jgi:glycine/D-amino acid oxidase-like deaminating enzyme